jgi:cache 3/cache 2 fusion protein
VPLSPHSSRAQDWQCARRTSDKINGCSEDHTAKLGAPKIEGRDAVGGKDAPALYFGLTKMNNNVAVVDEVVKAGGKGAAATLFVKDGDEFVRVATTVMKPDKTGRAVGTALDPGPALDALKTGKASTAPMTTLFSA